MDYKERAKIDIEKLEKALSFANKTFPNKYREAIEWASNYLNDSKYYYDKKDYFTSFGCANYAYGILDALFIIEGVKEKIYEEEGI